MFYPAIIFWKWHTESNITESFWATLMSFKANLLLLFVLKEEGREAEMARDQKKDTVIEFLMGKPSNKLFGCHSGVNVAA